MVSEVGAALDPGVVARRSVTTAQSLSGEQNIATETESSFRMFGKDGFSFSDFLDIVNPLQHIPVVGTIYRAITGDQLDPGSKLFGGALFGGPIGAALSAADVAVKHNTGKDVGEHALAFLDDDGDPAPEGGPTVQTATLEKYPAPTPPIEAAALAVSPRQPDATFSASTSPATATARTAGMSGIPESRTSPFAWADGNRALDEFYGNRQAKNVIEPAPDLGLLAETEVTPSPTAASERTGATPHPGQHSAADTSAAVSTADALRRLAQDLRAARQDQPAQASRSVTVAVTPPVEEQPGAPVSRISSNKSISTSGVAETPTAPGTPADGWMFQAMVRALEKYETTGTLPQANRSRGVSVVR